MSKTSTGAKVLMSIPNKNSPEYQTLTSASSLIISKSNEKLATLIISPSIPSIAPENSINPIIFSPTVSSAGQDEPHFRFWFPILFGLYEIIMSCDLEVRTRGLTYLFDALKLHGSSFSRESWETIVNGVLFPIFDYLRPNKKESSKFSSKDEMNVWLSTTLIQALRQFVDLFGIHMETLSFCFDGVLDLLKDCMTYGKFHVGGNHLLIFLFH